MRALGSEPLSFWTSNERYFQMEYKQTKTLAIIFFRKNHYSSISLTKERSAAFQCHKARSTLRCLSLCFLSNGENGWMSGSLSLLSRPRAWVYPTPRRLFQLWIARRCVNVRQLILTNKPCGAAFTRCRAIGIRKTWDKLSHGALTKG